MNSNKYKVLIVEDEGNIRHFVSVYNTADVERWSNKIATNGTHMTIGGISLVAILRYRTTTYYSK